MPTRSQHMRQPHQAYRLQPGHRCEGDVKKGTPWSGLVARLTV
jgi:hypothetical protein